MVTKMSGWSDPSSDDLQRFKGGIEIPAGCRWKVLMESFVLPQCDIATSNTIQLEKIVKCVVELWNGGVSPISGSILDPNPPQT